MMDNASFAAALLAPDAPIPLGLIDPQGRPAPRRFDVYRNNVTLGLIRVLQAGFPAVAKLVGEDFFTAMAAEFARTHPPKTRMMMLYGDDFAGFISDFAPASALGYLPDVARLEQAIRRSYHAADVAPIDASIFAQMDEAQILRLRFSFAPTMQIVSSPWPIHAIWAANMQDGPAPVMRADDVLVMRPEFDPAPYLLPPFGHDVLVALTQDQTLGEALSAADPRFDLTQLLTLLLRGGAITKVTKC